MPRLLLLLRLGLRLTLGGVFAFAAVGKLRGGAGGNDLATALLGGSAGMIIALAVFELLLATWLLSGVRPLAALVVTAVLLAGFSGVLAAEMRRPVPKPCGCLGAAAAQGPAAVRRGLEVSLLRNAALLAGVGGLVLLETSGAPRSAAAFAPAAALS